MKTKMRFLAIFLSMAFILSTGSVGFGYAKKAAEEPYTVKMAFMTFGTPPRDVQMVEDAINKVTLAKINEKVKLMPIGAGAFQQQLNLMLSGSEQLDLLSVFVTSFSQFVNRGQIIPLDKYLANEGKGIVSAVGKDNLAAGKVNGKIYAVTNLRDLAAGYGFAMRKDIADKYKINPKNIKSLSDLTKVFAVIKKNEPGMYPIVPSTVGSSILGPFGTGNDVTDQLTDGYGVLMLKDKSFKVTDWFESKEYADRVNLARSWNQAGYVLPDASTNQESQNALVKAGKGFGYITTTKPGIVSQESRNSGTDMEVADLGAVNASTSNVQIIQWGVAKNSKDPAKAVKMLNLFYTDSTVANLLAYGVEGKHYVKTSTSNVIDYPKGVDASSETYQIGVQWEFPNQFLTYVWKGDSPTIWKDMEVFNKTAIRSRAFGFSFASDSVKTEESSLANVTNQYRLALENGIVDPAKVLPEFISKLKSAGLSKVMAEKQKQLNTWFIANSKK